VDKQHELEATLAPVLAADDSQPLNPESREVRASAWCRRVGHGYTRPDTT